MQKRLSLKKIENAARELPPQEQLKLLEILVKQLRKTGISTKKEVGLDELYGIGKDLWAEEDAQEYINRLREDRV